MNMDYQTFRNDIQLYCGYDEDKLTKLQWDFEILYQNYISNEQQLERYDEDEYFNQSEFKTIF